MNCKISFFIKFPVSICLSLPDYMHPLIVSLRFHIELCNLSFILAVRRHTLFAFCRGTLNNMRGTGIREYIEQLVVDIHD